MQKLVLAIVFLLLSITLNAQEKISIQLKWKHGFQFAGYYAAIEKGFYANEGLEVNLKEVNLNRNFIKDVANAKSEYGVSDSSLVVYHLQKIPVVLVTQIFQHSPLVLISHRDSNITTPYEMVGKKISYSVNGTGGTPFRALILKTIGDFNKVDISDFSSYQNFIDKKIDITSAYSTSQPYWLKKQGVEVNVIDPKSYGIDFYGDNLFTSKKELQEHPLRVEKVRRATLKGWEYALSHQKEIINLILKKYAPNKKRDELEFEARGTYQMIMPDLTNLGSFSRQKYEQVAKTYKQLGIVNSENVEDDFFYNDKAHKLNLTEEEKKWIQDNPMVKIAVMDYWESDIYGDNIHTDYIKLLNKYGNLNIVPVKFDAWKDGFKEASSGLHIHGIVNLSKSKEREKKFLFTKAYNFTPHYLIVRNDENDIKSLEDLKNKTIYLKEKIIAHSLIKEMSDNIKVVNIRTDEEIYKKLSIKSDVVATVSYSIDRKKLKQYNLKIAKFSYDKYGKIYLALSHKYPLLQSIINKTYKLIPKEELTALQNKVYGKSKTLKLTQNEHNWLKQNPKVTFAGNPNWLPFEAFDKNGKYEGIVANYLESIQTMLPLKFKPRRTSTWLETLEKAKKGEVDVISDSINSYSMRKNYLPIKPYLNTPIVIVMRDNNDFINDIPDIRDKKIAVIEGYGYVNSIKKTYPNQKFLTVKDADVALEKLSDGKIDAAILSMPKAGHLIREKGYSNLKIVGKTSLSLHLTLFVLKSKPTLHSLLERVMDTFSPQEHAQMVKEWQKVEFAQKIDYSLLYKIAGLFALFLLGSFYWNRKLSYEIVKRKATEKELAYAKEEADKANLAKSEFLANMSHEIRTPMNSVMGFSELLAKQIKDPVQKDYLDSIQRGGNTLLNIINDILDLSKIEAGKLEMIPESVDIKLLAQEMESIFSVKLIQKNIHFKLDIDPTLPKYLLLDNTRIRQIFFNLIGNAIKFTSHGFVKLRIKKILEDEEKSKINLQICVEDSGMGIDEKNIENIFDAFEQQSGQDNQKYGGTGLGLAICKKLAIMMNDSICVKSTLGKGSTFTVTLSDIPISSIKATQKNRKKPPQRIEFKKATILIVDDIKDNRKLLASTLGEYNLDFIEAEDGKEAIELLRILKVDLIFMDIKMPVIDGYTANKIIKADEKLKNIPLIALTASVMGKDLDKIKEYNFDGYLRKPVSQEDLLTQMEIFLTHDIQELTDKEEENIDAQSYNNLPKVIKTLETKHTKTWEDIKDMGDFTLIASFGESLEKLGDKNGINILSYYAKELQKNCDSFDIDKIDFMMNSFPPLIEKLKGLQNVHTHPNLKFPLLMEFKAVRFSDLKSKPYP